MEQTYIPGSPFMLVPAPHGPSVLIDQAVRLLGVSKRTIYYWIRDGRLETFRTRCGSQRILLSSIHDLARDQAMAARRRVPVVLDCGITS